MELLSAPLKIDFNLTSRCNYDCDFCYVPNKKSSNYEMNLKDIEKVLSDLQQLNVLQINLSGGEPLIRKDILDILEVVRKYDFYYSFNTNGSLITKEIASEMKKCNFEFVGVSIDASNEGIYQLNRKTVNNFQNTVNGIKYLLNEDINVSLGITLTKYNISNVVETLEFSASLGIKTVGIQFICPNNENALNVMPSYKQWKECFLNITELKKKNKIPVNINFNTTNESPIPWELYLPLKENNQLEDLKEVWGYEYDNVDELNVISCCAGIYSCAIASDGEVYGCEMFFPYKELSKGNAIKQSFKDIWDKFNFDNRIIMKNELSGACSNCTLSFCGGGCRASAIFFGDSNGPDMRCPIAQGKMC